MDKEFLNVGEEFLNVGEEFLNVDKDLPSGYPLIFRGFLRQTMPHFASPLLRSVSLFTIHHSLFTNLLWAALIGTDPEANI